MGRYMRFACALLAACLITGCFAGCQDATTSEIKGANDPVVYDWIVGESPVPNVRTGIKRQCVTTSNKKFECTDSGVYFIVACDYYLIYSDHGSDQFIEVCTRPDCGHADYEGYHYFDCDANFSFARDIAWFDGYLYYFDDDSYALMRMDADGTNRVEVLNLSESLGAYQLISYCGLWNGVLSYTISDKGESGITSYSPYYYKLDGSMEAPEPCDVILPAFNDGDNFIYSAVTEDGGLEYRLWDPDTNTSTYLTDIIDYGYYGAEEAYLLFDGVLSRLTYADQSIAPLFDTGLTGELYLHCYPDCLVIAQIDSQLNTTTLYFYNWAYEDLGSVTLDYVVPLDSSGIVCGETHERILLAKQSYGVPEYYIDKAELGTGNIQVHAFDLPQLPAFEGITVIRPADDPDW